MKQEIQPSKVEILAELGLYPRTGSSWMTSRTALIHYRDEISGNEKVVKVSL